MASGTQARTRSQAGAHARGGAECGGRPGRGRASRVGSRCLPQRFQTVHHQPDIESARARERERERETDRQTERERERKRERKERREMGGWGERATDREKWIGADFDACLAVHIPIHVCACTCIICIHMKMYVHIQTRTYTQALPYQVCFGAGASRAGDGGANGARTRGAPSRTHPAAHGRSRRRSVTLRGLDGIHDSIDTAGAILFCFCGAWHVEKGQENLREAFRMGKRKERMAVGCCRYQ